MPAALVATRPAVGEVGGREHEQTGHGVCVARLAAVECGVMGGEDLGALWVVEGQAVGMGLVQRPGHGTSL